VGSAPSFRSLCQGWRSAWRWPWPPRRLARLRLLPPALFAVGAGLSGPAVVVVGASLAAASGRKTREPRKIRLRARPLFVFGFGALAAARWLGLVPAARLATIGDLSKTLVLGGVFALSARLAGHRLHADPPRGAAVARDGPRRRRGVPGHAVDRLVSAGKTKSVALMTSAALMDSPLSSRPMTKANSTSTKGRALRWTVAPSSRASPA
jgi:hypothetical protein